MKISFYSQRIDKLYHDDKQLVKKYGFECAERLINIAQVVNGISNYKELMSPPFMKYNFHELKGDMQYQWSIRLSKSSGVRLVVFLLDEDDEVIKDISRQDCVCICVKEIRNYHHG